MKNGDGNYLEEQEEAEPLRKSSAHRGKEDDKYLNTSPSFLPLEK